MPLGIADETRNDAITLTNTSVQVAVGRPRRAIYFRNSSAGVQVITVVPSNIQAAVDGYGIVLKPGEFFMDSSVAGENDDNGYRCYQGPYQAISTAAGAILSIFER